MKAMIHPKIRALAGTGLFAALLAGPAFGQAAAAPGAEPPRAEAPADQLPEATEKAKESAAEAQDSVGDAAKETSESAKDDAGSARESVKEVPDSTREATDDKRNAAPEKSRDAAATDTEPSERAPRSSDTSAREGRDRDLPARERSEARSSESERNSRTNAGATASIRSADIGLWFDSSARSGLVINDVSTRGAIAKLGFREGDRVVSVDGRRVTREADFIEYLFADDVRNERVEVVVVRDDRDEVIVVEPAVLYEEYQYVDNDPAEHFGVVLDDRYPDRLVVWKVIPQSPAYYAGIRAGDVITTFRGQRLASANDFVRVVSDIDAGPVPVEVRRDDRVRSYNVEVPQFQARGARQSVLRADSNVERLNERREERIEQRRENRRDDRRDVPNVAPAVNPAPQVVPGVAPAPQVNPGVAPAPRENPRPGLLPRRR
jgi:C-terminal processing protease CtpA/Prc